jgi:hypothetical protein
MRPALGEDGKLAPPPLPVSCPRLARFLVRKRQGPRRPLGTSGLPDFTPVPCDPKPAARSDHRSSVSTAKPAIRRQERATKPRASRARRTRSRSSSAGAGDRTATNRRPAGQTPTVSGGFCEVPSVRHVEQVLRSFAHHGRRAEPGHGTLGGRGVGLGEGRDGTAVGNLVATYLHLHALGTPEWAPALVRAAAERAALSTQRSAAASGGTRCSAVGCLR